jgi:hypothetical protein
VQSLIYFAKNKHSTLLSQRESQRLNSEYTNELILKVIPQATLTLHFMFYQNQLAKAENPQYSAAFQSILNSFIVSFISYAKAKEN